MYCAWISFRRFIPDEHNRCQARVSRRRRRSAGRSTTSDRADCSASGMRCLPGDCPHILYADTQAKEFLFAIIQIRFTCSVPSETGKRYSGTIHIIANDAIRRLKRVLSVFCGGETKRSRFL